MNIEALSKIKSKKFRKLVFSMALTSEIIHRMEQYHKEHYEHRES